MSKDKIKRAIERAVKAMPYGKDVCRVRLFGSHLHGDAGDDSDIDLIIDFDEQAKVGLFKLIDIEDAFRKELQCEVDVVTPGGIKQYIRDKVLGEAETLYERAG